MTKEQIKQMADKLKHDLYIRGIDPENCSELYYMLMYDAYKNAIENLDEVVKK